MGSSFIGSGGSPGGSTTQVQFNDSGAFGGDAGLTYNKTTDTLSVGLILPGHDTSILIGSGAGAAITSGSNNTFVGPSAGTLVTSGHDDIIIGFAGYALVGGSWNVIVGDNIGIDLASGNENVLIGDSAALDSVAGASYNVIIGSSCASDFLGGNYNVVIGYRAGADAVTGNVILGSQTARNAGAISNQLWIDNSTTDTPLIFGDFAANALTINGTLTATGVIKGAGYKSSDDSTGATQDVTTGTLVGKTMSFKNGLLVSFA